MKIEKRLITLHGLVRDLSINLIISLIVSGLVSINFRSPLVTFSVSFVVILLVLSLILWIRNQRLIKFLVLRHQRVLLQLSIGR